MNTTGLAIAIIIFCVSLSASAETLNFASPAAPRASLHSQVIEPWVEKVVADSEGTLNIRTFYSSPLGNYRNMYDRVLDGVVHIAFTTLAPIGGQFVQTDVAALPFEVENGVEASKALWRLYERGVIADEYADIKVLGIFAFPPSALHMGSKPIRTLEDFGGVKLRTAGKMQSDTLVLLGAAPVTTAIGDTYQGLNRGVFDGAVIPWSGIGPFRLDEVTKYHLNAPLGASTAMIFMNRDTYEGLPEAARASIDKHSGLSLSIWGGEHMQADSERNLARVASQEDQTLVNITPEEAARWKEALVPQIQTWVNRTPDGERILAEFREEIRLIREAGE